MCPNQKILVNCCEKMHFQKEGTLSLSLSLSPVATREETLCVLANPAFVVYSSIVSFYVPFIITLLVYVQIYVVLRKRRKRVNTKRACHAPETTLKVTHSSNTHTNTHSTHTHTHTHTHTNTLITHITHTHTNTLITHITNTHTHTHTHTLSYTHTQSGFV